MAPRAESTPESLHESLAAIFDQAQTSLANHRKNCVALYKLHVKAGGKKRAAQAAFIAAFLDMVSRVIVVKKGPPTVDRIIKFVAHYVRFVNEKVQEEKAKRQADVPTNSISSGSIEDEDTLASVFVSAILEWIIQGFLAKNKVVRYQSVHLVAEMILYLGEIDEDSYLVLRENLIERSTCDKESTIRSQAVSALARLVGSEDPSELQHGEKSILNVLLDVLSSDPAPDVRRAALQNVPLTADTLPALLARTRDVDPLTRKLVYTRMLPLPPQHLTIAQREQLAQTGLGDRVPAVRLAAATLVRAWFDAALDTDAPNPDAGDEDDMTRATAFLALFDVVGPGEAVAGDALRSVLAARPGLLDACGFAADVYWQELTPEAAVLARVVLEAGSPGEAEERLPVVTAFAFHVQEAYNGLLRALEDAGGAGADMEEEGDAEDAADALEEAVATREAVLGELLRIAVRLDYMDEIGRRKVYAVTRDMLAHPQLPPGLIARCLDVLAAIMPTERELVRVVVEVVMDLREPEDEGEENDHDTTQSTLPRERSMRRAKAREEMSAAEGARADLTDMRCLALCVGMLERVHGNFEDNSTLEGILADLIVPAVRRKELGIRELGLVGLGLCCLIAKSIAVKSLQLFLSQIQHAPAQLKLKLLQIVFDLLVMYGEQLWGRDEDGDAIRTFLADTLEAEGEPSVQAVLCVGLAKLLLAGLADDPKILKSLLLAYVSPQTAGNAELRQCLAYFFGVYCYASPTNQSRLQSIFMPAFDEVVRMHEELGEGQTMVTPHQFGLLVIDWTDAEKAAETSEPQYVHADFAVDILLALYDSDRRSEDQEVLCTLLSHLHVEPALPPPLLVKLSILLEHVQTQCPFDDPALDKAVGRFKTRVMGAFAGDIARLEPTAYATDEVRELCDFIGIDVPEWDARETGVERSESPAPVKGRKAGKRARSKSKAASEGSERDSDADPEGDEDEDGAPPPSPVPGRKPTPIKNLPPEENAHGSVDDSEDGDGDENGEEEEAPPASPVLVPKARTKTKPSKPARKSRSKPPPEESAHGSGEDGKDGEEDEDEAPPPLVTKKASKPARKSRSKPPPEKSAHGSGDDEDEEQKDGGEAPPVNPPPVPKARTKTNKPPRKSRSKPSPEENVHGSDGDEAPPPNPIPARKPVRRSRSKTAPPPPEESERGSDDEDEDEDPPPSPVPVRKATAKPSTRQTRMKAAPPPAEDVDSDAENEAPPGDPVTPKKGRKRGRAPAAQVALPSPAEKKRSRLTSPRRKPERSAAAAVPARGTRSSSRRKPPPAAVDDEPPAMTIDSDDEFGGYSES